MEFVTDQHVHLTFTDDPLPVDLIYGSFYAIIQRFVPRNADITVQREVQDNTYLFHLSW